MDRSGNTISFSQPEHDEFDVPLTMLAEAAVETALTYQEVAGAIIDRIAAASDTTNFRDIQANRTKVARATRLSIFSAQILTICPDEYLASIANGRIAPTQS